MPPPLSEILFVELTVAFIFVDCRIGIPGKHGSGDRLTRQSMFQFAFVEVDGAKVSIRTREPPQLHSESLDALWIFRAGTLFAPVNGRNPNR